MLYLILNYVRDLFRPNRDLLLENMDIQEKVISARSPWQNGYYREAA